MGKPITWSQDEVAQLLREDPLNKTRVQLICGRHSYLGSETPPQPNGCKECWQAYWWYQIASTPPHLRAERLEAAYRVISNAVKAHERGEFDFEPLARPEITTTHTED